MVRLLVMAITFQADQPSCLVQFPSRYADCYQAGSILKELITRQSVQDAYACEKLAEFACHLNGRRNSRQFSYVHQQGGDDFVALGLPGPGNEVVWLSAACL